LAFTSGTESYQLDSYITELSTVKWIDDVLVDSDENREFTKRDAEYFRKRRGINKTTEEMFADEYLGGTRNLLIYHHSTATLNLIWYSNYIVKDASDNRATKLPASDNDAYEFLVPEEYMDAVIDLTCAYLYLQDRNEASSSYATFLGSGRARLQDMVNSLGMKEVKPVEQASIRSEWGIYESKK